MKLSVKPFIKIFALSASVFSLAGCLVDDSTSTSSNTSPITTTETDTSRALSNSDTALLRTLEALANNVFTPNFTQFETDTQQLQTAVTNYCAALETASETSALESAQAGWSQALSTWQRISAAKVEPITDNGNRLGGRIYSWPDAVSTCTLDTQVVRSQVSGYDIETAPRQGRGLDALEYLLFNSNLNSTCSTLISETLTWNALTDVEKRAQRCDYATQITEDLNNNATALTQAWDVYKTNLTQPGTDRFETASQALNQITDALFFLDTETKDRKLASVLGFANGRGTCGNTTCPELRESPWSDNALQNVRDNLLGFRQVFIASLTAQAANASDQVGFDYQLAVRNFPDLATTLLTRTDEAIAIIDTYVTNTGQSLTTALNTIESNNLSSACVNASSNRTVSAGTEVCALHGTLKSITDLLKTDFLTLMTLSLPERVEGDND